MHQRIMQVLVKHEQEDRQAVGTLPWQELMRNDFCNVEEIITLIQARMDDAGLQLETIQSLYHAVQVSPGQFSVPAFIRTEGQFYVHRHTSSFRAYFHSHDFYELVYVHQGHCVQHIPASPLPMLLGQGVACLLAPGAVHALEPGSENDVVLKIAVPLHNVRRLMKICGGACRILEQLLQENGGILVLQTGVSRFDALLPALLEECFYPTTYSEDAITAWLTLLTTELARLKAGVKPASPLLEAVAGRLRTEGLDTSLQDIAALLGYSADHLSRRIRQECGESFSALRQRLKLDETARLLRETNIPVDAIAVQVGYSSTSGFYKRFQAVYGITPAAYRRMMA